MKMEMLGFVLFAIAMKASGVLSQPPLYISLDGKNETTQCEEINGIGSKAILGQDSDDLCVFWCSNPNGGGPSEVNYPNGTKCSDDESGADNKFCFKNKCVGANKEELTICKMYAEQVNFSERDEENPCQINCFAFPNTYSMKVPRNDKSFCLKDGTLGICRLGFCKLEN